MRNFIIVMLLFISLLVSDFVNAKQLADSRKMDPISHIRDIFVGSNKQLVVSMGGVQSSGAIVYSDNGGRKWQVAYNDRNRPARNLFAQEGRLVASYYDRIESLDYGKTWFEVDSGIFGHLNFYFRYSGIAYASDELGQLYDTHNSVFFNLEMDGEPYDRGNWGVVTHSKLSFVLAEGKLFRTEKLGGKWVQVYTDFVLPKYFNQFKMSKSGRLYIHQYIHSVNGTGINSRGVLHTSTDQGRSWEQVFLDLPSELDFDILELIDDIVYFRIIPNERSNALGYANQVYRSDNGGKITKLPFDDIALIRHGAQHEIYLARRGADIIYKSTNAGKVFLKLPSLPVVDFAIIPAAHEPWP
jgi:photosystem II stability/assembly factor-like uncharacterized protein